MSLDKDKNYNSNVRIERSFHSYSPRSFFKYLRSSILMFMLFLSVVYSLHYNGFPKYQIIVSNTSRMLLLKLLSRLLHSNISLPFWSSLA